MGLRGRSDIFFRGRKPTGKLSAIWQTSGGPGNLREPRPVAFPNTCDLLCQGCELRPSYSECFLTVQVSGGQLNFKLLVFLIHLNEFLLDLCLSRIDWVKKALARREQAGFRDPVLSRET